MGHVGQFSLSSEKVLYVYTNLINCLGGNIDYDELIAVGCNETPVNIGSKEGEITCNKTANEVRKNFSVVYLLTTCP